MVCVARRFRDRLVYKHRKRHRMWPTPPHSEQLSLLQSGKGGSSSSTAENAARNREDIRHRLIFIPPIILRGSALFECRGRVWRRVVAGVLLLSDPSRFARRSRSCRCKKINNKKWVDPEIAQIPRWGWHKIIGTILYFFLINSESLPAPPHFVYNLY